MASDRALARLIAIVLIVGACERQTPPDRGAPRQDLAAKAAADSIALALSPAAKAQLDSGNVRFRSKDFAGALRYYRRAAQESPAHAAPLFGIYMVGRATADTALADSAMAGIRARNTVPPHDLPDSIARPRPRTDSKRGSGA